MGDWMTVNIEGTGALDEECYQCAPGSDECDDPWLPDSREGATLKVNARVREGR